MKFLIPAILLLTLLSCEDEPTYCFECSTTTKTIVDGFEETSVKKQEYCGITQDRADEIKDGSTANSQTSCQRK